MGGLSRARNAKSEQRLISIEEVWFQAQRKHKRRRPQAVELEARHENTLQSFRPLSWINTRAVQSAMVALSERKPT